MSDVHLRRAETHLSDAVKELGIFMESHVGMGSDERERVNEVLGIISHQRQELVALEMQLRLRRRDEESP